MDRLQIILFALAIAFVLYQALMGWRLGVVRQLLKIISLASAYLGAVFLGDLLLPMLRVTGYPDFATRPVAALIMGVLCYLIVSFSGRLLFKKTSDQSIGFVWLFYGVAGSMLGVVFALFFVGLMAVALRFMGTFAAGLSEPVDGSALQSASTSRQATVSGLVQIRETLESGATGSVVRTIDPVPEQTYRLAEKIGRVSTNPAAIQRFMSYPGAEQLAKRPEIASLRDRPDVAQALHEGRYLSLLMNPAVMKAARSPRVAELIRNFDLEAALDHAIGEPPATPAPPADAVEAP